MMHNDNLLYNGIKLMLNDMVHNDNVDHIN